MIQTTLRLPPKLYSTIKALAKKKRCDIQQFSCISVMGDCQIGRRAV